MRVFQILLLLLPGVCPHVKRMQKTSSYEHNPYTRQSALLLACLLLPACRLSVEAANRTHKLTAFFQQRLQQGEPIAVPPAFSKTVSVKDIAKFQTLVWQAWQEANAASGEERLMPLTALSPRNSGCWHLPDSLEPAARMPYYWGAKAKALTADEIALVCDSLAAPGDSTAAGREVAPEAPLPLFLYLHGSGPKDDEWRIGLRWALFFDDAPAAYFVPQIPNEGAYYRWWQRAKQYAWEKLLRLSLATGRIDANRLYLFGISEGGYGSQRLASFYADYLAAAGPMAGGEPLKNAPVENCANIGFSLLTGALDSAFYRNRLTSYTQAAFDSLQAVYATPPAADSLFRHRIALMAGRRHAIDYTPTTPWLRRFVRNPHPKTVLWEDFAMDGRHRDGFYNIRVEERPADRTYYQMVIRDNVIRLTVDDVEYTTTEKDPIWGIELKFLRHYKPSTKGKWRIYLNESLVDLQRPVTVWINHRKVFEGKVEANLKDMVASCQEFFDPCRIYPASVEVAL